VLGFQADPTIGRGWPPEIKYLAATLAVALAGGAAAWAALPTFAVFWPVVVLCAVALGSRTGLHAALLGGAVTWILLLAPRFSFAVEDPQEGRALIVHLALAVPTAAALERCAERLAAGWARLRDCELALREYSHRRRNNLQIAASMLIAQGRAAAASAARDELSAAADRIASLVRVEDQLELKRSGGEVEMERFLVDLGQDLRDALFGPRPVALEISADPIRLDPGRAQCVGLIMNELVTNALKYAFPGDRGGRVAVRLSRDGDHAELRVSDNGVGLATGGGRARGSGSQIVLALATQLDGTLEAGANPGASMTVRFPLGGYRAD